MLKFVLGLISLIFVGLTIFVYTDKENKSEKASAVHKTVMTAVSPSKKEASNVEPKFLNQIKLKEHIEENKDSVIAHSIPKKIEKTLFSDELTLDKQFDSTSEEIQKLTVEDIEKYEKNILKEEKIIGMKDEISYNPDTNEIISELKNVDSFSPIDQKNDKIKLSHNKLIELEENVDDLVDTGNKNESFYNDDSIKSLIDN